MGQGQSRHPSHILWPGLFPAFPAGQSGAGAADREIGPQPLGSDRGTQCRYRVDDARPEGGRSGRGQPGRQGRLGGRVGAPYLLRGGVELETSAHGGGPLGRIAGGAHLDRQAEAIEKLGPEVALLWVHGSDQHEAAGVSLRHSFPLDPVDAAGGHVEQHVDQVVGQQVDLVHVQDTVVRRRQQARGQPGPPASEGRGQVQRADHPILRCS